MPAAGDLIERIRFEARALDANGDRAGAWGSAVTMAAAIKTLLGSVRGAEEVMGERLQGRQPVVITVRSCAATRAIDTTWRAVDARSGAIYGIKSLNPLPSRYYIEFLAVAEGGGG